MSGCSACSHQERAILMLIDNCLEPVPLQILYATQSNCKLYVTFIMAWNSIELRKKAQIWKSSYKSGTKVIILCQKYFWNQDYTNKNYPLKTFSSPQRWYLIWKVSDIFATVQNYRLPPTKINMPSLSSYNGNRIFNLWGLDEPWEQPFFLNFVRKQPFPLLSCFLTCSVTEVGVSVLQMPGVIIVVVSVLYNVMLSSTVPWISRLQYTQTTALGTGDKLNRVYQNYIKEHGTE